MVEQIEERRNRVYKYWESMAQITVTAYMRGEVLRERKMHANRKFKIFLCIVFLLGLQINGCGNKRQTDIDGKINTDILIKENDFPGEDNIKYTEVLSEMFYEKAINLSENIYFYKDKMYVDYIVRSDANCWWENSEYARVVLGWQDGEIVLTDILELPATWDRKSCGSENYIISGDHYKQWIQVYNLDTGDTEYFTVGSDKIIAEWEVRDGILYYCVLDQSGNENICGFELHVKKLSQGWEQVMYCDEQISNVYFMSVNKRGEVGLIYTDDLCEDHLGIIYDGHLSEADTSNMEIWNVDRKEHHCFRLTDDGKMMICTEDVSHTIVSIPAWSCSYEIDPDGEWKYIPYEYNTEHILGYVHYFYYLDNHYLAYWDKRNFTNHYGLAVLCNARGECCGMVDQISTTSVYFAYSNDTVYVISMMGDNVEQLSVEVEKMYYE